MKKHTPFIIYLITLICLLGYPALAEEADSLKRFSVGTRFSSMNIGTTNLETGELGDVEGQFNGSASYSVNFTYFITKRYSVELSIDQLESKLKVRYDSEKGDLGELEQRPTLLTARMHFPINELNGNFYLGAGVGHYYNDFENFSDEDESEINDLFAQNMTIAIRESYGFHLAVGSEYFISKHFALNLDIKLVMNNTKCSFKPFGLAPQERDVSMNASFLGIGLKYYF